MQIFNHVCMHSAFKIIRFPYSHGVCSSARFWIESHATHGQRNCSQFLNRLNGKWKLPRYQGYTDLCILELDTNPDSLDCGLITQLSFNLFQMPHEQLALLANYYAFTNFQKSKILKAFDERGMSTLNINWKVEPTLLESQVNGPTSAQMKEEEAKEKFIKEYVFQAMHNFKNPEEQRSKQTILMADLAAQQGTVYEDSEQNLSKWKTNKLMFDNLLNREYLKQVLNIDPDIISNINRLIHKAEFGEWPNRKKGPGRPRTINKSSSNTPVDNLTEPTQSTQSTEPNAIVATVHGTQFTQSELDAYNNDYGFNYQPGHKS